METEGKDTVPRTIQSPKHANAEHPEARRQSSNRAKDKQGHLKETQSRKLHYSAIRTDQQETGETSLVLAHSAINQIETVTSTRQHRLCY